MEVESTSEEEVVCDENPDSLKQTKSNLGSVSHHSDRRISAHRFLPVLWLYIGLRVCLFLCNVLAASITRASNWLGPFAAWDGNWYIRVARSWYVSAGFGTDHLTYAPGGFEPGWPALIKFGTIFGLGYPASAFLMSILIGAVTAFAIWRLSLELVPNHSLVATAAALVFPGSAVVFGIAYSEVLSIGCAAATLYLLIKRKWIWAGFASAIATGTSSLAVVLCLACVVEALLAITQHKNYRSIWAVVLSPIGFVGFVAYLGYKSGDLFYWWKLQGQAWGARIDLGFIFSWLKGGTGSGWGTFWMALIGLVVLVYLIVTVIQSEFPLSVKLYCVAIAVMVLINPALGPKPRFLFWLFPSVLLLPRNLRPKVLNPVVIFMALLLPLVVIAYTTIGNSVAQP